MWCNIYGVIIVRCNIVIYILQEASARVSGVQQLCKRTFGRGRFFFKTTKSIIRNSESGAEQGVLRGAAVAASEARMVHVRPGRLPSTETGLALCTDRPRAEDPGRSGRSELSGSGPAPGGQERDRLEFQLSLSLHDGSWPSVGPTGPSKDPKSRGAMG